MYLHCAKGELSMQQHVLRAGSTQHMHFLLSALSTVACSAFLRIPANPADHALAQARWELVKRPCPCRPEPCLPLLQVQDLKTNLSRSS